MDKIVYFQNIIEPKTTSLVVPIILICFFIVCVVGTIGVIHNMKNITINVSNENLTIKSLFYGRTISLDKINIDTIKKINLNIDSEYNIKYRTGGIGLPNFYLGWMKLNNGHKALVYLTDRTNVILIPTDEYDIMFSSGDIDGLKNSLTR